MNVETELSENGTAIQVQDGLIQDGDNNNNREDEAKPPSWCMLWKNREYRGKLIRSFCIGMGFLCLGTTQSLNGATFLDIQIITSTDTQTASVFFTVHSLGYLLGCLLAGILNRKLGGIVLIFTSLTAIAAILIITPYCSNLASMMVAKLFGGMFAGLLNTNLNAEQMRLWGNEGRVILQILFFMFACGGLASPLISAPFLADKANTTSILATDINDSTTGFIQSYDKIYSFDKIINESQTKGNNSNNTLESQSNGFMNFVEEGPVPRDTDVHYAFLITGIMACAASIPFILILFKDKRQSKVKVIGKRTGKVQESVSEESYRKIPRRLQWMLFAMLGSFYFFYSGIEVTFDNLLMTFLVKEYEGVSKAQSAHILFLFWTCSACSRILMIFLAKRFTSLQLLATSVTFLALNFVIFAAVASQGQVLLISIFAGVLGFSMSGIFAAGFSWSESEYHRVSSSLAACILMFCTVGVMVNPLLVVYTMEQFGNMSFCYVFVVEMVLLVTILIILVSFNRRYLNRKYGPLRRKRN